MLITRLIVLLYAIVFPVFFLAPAGVHAGQDISAFELVYDEKEEGTDFYTVRFTVSDKLIRIDNSSTAETGGHDESTSMQSGYIIFDITDEVIYSVSHFDKSILVIPKYPYTVPDEKLQTSVIYEPSKGAPPISGKQVFNYKVTSKTKDEEEVCMDIQVASGLWPQVTSRLQRYQSVIAGQQMKNIITTPEEYRTPCFMIDQIYNDGPYYEKGLPVYEWHSNNKIRMLKLMNEVNVKDSIFDLPVDYRRFKLEESFE